MTILKIIFTVDAKSCLQSKTQGVTTYNRLCLLMQGGNPCPANYIAAMAQSVDRSRLKICRGYPHVGSSPTSSTIDGTVKNGYFNIVMRIAFVSSNLTITNGYVSKRLKEMT